MSVQRALKYMQASGSPATIGVHDTSELPTTMVLGLPVHRLTMDEVMEQVTAAIDGRRRLRIGVVNAAKLVNMEVDPMLDSDVRSSDLILADGMSVVWTSCLAQERLPERVAGIDLMHRILARGGEAGWRVFLLGAKPEIVETVAERALRDYPGLAIAGVQHGYFAATEESAIVQRINESSADVLLVAMTSPLKERFMGQWANHLCVPLIHGVGGSFDVYAGLVNRAPAWMQRIGMEWLYRVAQEPGRLWKRYLLTNARYLLRVVRSPSR